MDNKDKAIGVFDSGLGGISVLKEFVKSMPSENFNLLYFKFYIFLIVILIYSYISI